MSRDWPDKRRSGCRWQWARGRALCGALLVICVAVKGVTRFLAMKQLRTGKTRGRQCVAEPGRNTEPLIGSKPRVLPQAG